MSGASSLRNSVKRITHKERSQPSWRKKFGFLEKHKDYLVRAKDYQKKQKHLRNLRKKAADRNEDEFYFNMHKSKVLDGVHKDTKDSTLDVESVKLLKTQDMGYLVHRKAIDDRKVEKLRQNLHFIGDTKPKSHKIFMDDVVTFNQFDFAKHFETVPELLGRAHNRPKTSEIEKMYDNLQSTKTNTKTLERTKEISYRELDSRVKRAEKITRVMQNLATQRHLMGKGSKRKVQEETENGIPALYKWKRQRSR